MKLNETEFLTEYRKLTGGNAPWSSSALELDNELKRIGIALPKFYHEYKLPASKEQLISDSYRMQAFAMSEEIAKEYNLALSDELIAKLPSLKVRALAQINEYVDYIKQNNPNLQNIVIPSTPKHKIHFIRGAGFGFPPENIEYFITNLDMFEQGRRELATLNVKQKLGIKIGCIRLTDRQCNDILNAAATKQKPNINDYIEHLARRGHYDD